MYSKLIFLVVAACVVGLWLLSMRQQRLELMHEMTDLYRRTHTARQGMWALQSRASTHLTPDSLHAAVERSRLYLESATQRSSYETTLDPETNPRMTWIPEEARHDRR